MDEVTSCDGCPCGSYGAGSPDMACKMRFFMLTQGGIEIATALEAIKIPKPMSKKAFTRFCPLGTTPITIALDKDLTVLFAIADTAAYLKWVDNFIKNTPLDA